MDELTISRLPYSDYAQYLTEISPVTDDSIDKYMRKWVYMGDGTNYTPVKLFGKIPKDGQSHYITSKVNNGTNPINVPYSTTFFVPKDDESKDFIKKSSDAQRNKYTSNVLERTQDEENKVNEALSNQKYKQDESLYIKNLSAEQMTEKILDYLNYLFKDKDKEQMYSKIPDVPEKFRKIQMKAIKTNKSDLTNLNKTLEQIKDNLGKHDKYDNLYIETKNNNGETLLRQIIISDITLEQNSYYVEFPQRSFTVKYTDGTLQKFYENELQDQQVALYYDSNPTYITPPPSKRLLEYVSYLFKDDSVDSVFNKMPYDKKLGGGRHGRRSTRSNKRKSRRGKSSRRR